MSAIAKTIWVIESRIGAPVSLDELAAHAGVSLATVDRVLNQRKGVRDRTVSLVLSSALEIGYLSEMDYENLSKPRPPNIVFLLPNGTNPYLRLLGERVRVLADDTSRTMLFENSTSSTVDHGAAPSWLRTVKSTANPFCASGQLRSSTLPSITTRRAFLSSSRFFTAHRTPT